MVIRRQPVISWLLEKNYFFDPTKISILRVENIIHQEYLLNGMRHLAQVREMNPDWYNPHFQISIESQTKRLNFEPFGKTKCSKIDKHTAQKNVEKTRFFETVC